MQNPSISHAYLQIRDNSDGWQRSSEFSDFIKGGEHTDYLRDSSVETVYGNSCTFQYFDSVLTGILLLNELGYLYIKEKRITVCAVSQGFVNSAKSLNLCSTRCKYVV
jgi:hypothetical protein